MKNISLSNGKILYFLYIKQNNLMYGFMRYMCDYSFIRPIMYVLSLVMVFVQQNRVRGYICQNYIWILSRQSGITDSHIVFLLCHFAFACLHICLYNLKHYYNISVILLFEIIVTDIYLYENGFKKSLEKVFL